MGNPRQKLKARSSISKARRKPKSKKRILNNAIIAANWDKTQTLSQNYRRLGLTAKLNKTTGGVEKTAEDLREDDEDDRLKIHALKAKSDGLKSIAEARIVRDPESGRILQVLDDGAEKENPLGDPLNDLDSDEESEQEGLFNQHGAAQTHMLASKPKTAVVGELEQQASRPAAKYKRKQTDGEREFISELVTKYGNDYAAMARDIKINYMQRSEGDLKKRIKKWRENGGEVR